jgi:hypothetical protein
MSARPVDLPAQRRLAWNKTYRIIPSRYPPIQLFERIGDPADWETLAHIEGLTNDRLRDEIGEISAVPAAERISGPGASPIMAAFTHLGFPSRFGDGAYGIYYASDRLEAALREVAYHHGRFLARTSEPPHTLLAVRTYVGRAAAKFHDVRGGWPDVHDPTSYVQSQRLGRAVRAAGSNGIVYDAVRMKGAHNLAVFRPRAVASPAAGRAHVIEGPHFFLSWDGRRIDRYLEVGRDLWQSLQP